MLWIKYQNTPPAPSKNMKRSFSILWGISRGLVHSTYAPMAYLQCTIFYQGWSSSLIDPRDLKTVLMLISQAIGKRILQKWSLALPSLGIVGLFSMQHVSSSGLLSCKHKLHFLPWKRSTFYYLSLKDVIPIMQLTEETKGCCFQVICTNPHVHCKVFKDNSGALELARLPKLSTNEVHQLVLSPLLQACTEGINQDIPSRD